MAAGRGTGFLHANDGIPLPADTVCTFLIAGSSGQAMDWPEGTAIVRLSGMSTVGASLNFMVNMFSTACSVPSSGSSNSSTGTNHPVMGSGYFQKPSGSTGFSVAALSSGYVIAECWKR